MLIFVAPRASETKMADYFEIKGGKRIPKGCKLLNTNTGYPYIRVTDFTENGSVSLNDIHFISKEIYEQIKNINYLIFLYWL